MNAFRQPAKVILLAKENNDLCLGVDHPDHPYDAASQFSHAALEQRISPSASYHVGIRGPTYRPGVMGHTRSLGYNVITMRDYVRRGEADVLAELHDAMKGRPVYLSWDMDSFDRSVAPRGVHADLGRIHRARGIAVAARPRRSRHRRDRHQHR
jgi:hypothetical protein